MLYFNVAGLYFFVYLLYIIWPIIALILLSCLIKFRFALPTTIVLVVSLLFLGPLFYATAGVLIAVIGFLYFISM